MYPCSLFLFETTIRVSNPSPFGKKKKKKKVRDQQRMISHMRLKSFKNCLTIGSIPQLWELYKASLAVSSGDQSESTDLLLIISYLSRHDGDFNLSFFTLY